MPKLTPDGNRQYSIGSALLLMFSTPFIVWQMGILYFSGSTMSLFGRTPIPLTDGNTTLVIAAGYLLSALFICLFPRKAVYAERVLLPAALTATVLMLFPFPAQVLTALFYISAFVCVFSIGTTASVAAHHFTLDTAWRDGIISIIIGGVLIAVLQNEIEKIGFTAFTVFSILLIAAQTAFYFIIPAKISVRYASRKEGQRMPAALFLGIWLISGFATLLICFASSFAESVKNGVSVMYLSAAVMAVILGALRRKLCPGSLRIYGIFLALSVFGFVLAFLSLQIPALMLPACILLGFIVVLANLWIFFAAASFKVYPTRFIGAIGAMMGLLLAVLHSGLLDALRSNMPLLFGIYAALSVALLLIYYFMEPYFLRMWNAPPHEQADLQEEASSGRLAADASVAAPHPFDTLSDQERVLALLILDGHTESSAAKAMNISLNTQKSYRRNIYIKLDLHSRRELFELAERHRTGPASVTKNPPEQR